VAEFDRVHYPLPLLPCEPRAVRLSGAAVGGGAVDAALRAENATLRAQLAALRAATPRDVARTSSGRETAELSARLEASEAELEALGAAHAALRARAAADAASLGGQLAAAREGERAWRLKARDVRAECEALQRRLRATEARVGLRGAAASANFTYARPGSRPSSVAGGSRPPSPYAYALSSAAASPRGGGSAASSRGGSPAPHARGRPPSRPRERSPGGGGGAISAASSLRGRFDPAAYAAERSQRLAAAVALRASFGTSAPRGGASPGPGSRTGSPGGWRSPAGAPASPRRYGGGGGGSAYGVGGARSGGASPRPQSPSAVLRGVTAKLAPFSRGGADRARAATPNRAAPPQLVRSTHASCAHSRTHTDAARAHACACAGRARHGGVCVCDSGH
jgi:hypothetical protein